MNELYFSINNKFLFEIINILKNEAFGWPIEFYVPILLIHILISKSILFKGRLKNCFELNKALSKSEYDRILFPSGINNCNRNRQSLKEEKTVIINQIWRLGFRL